MKLDFSNKKIVVLGAGVEGQSTKTFLQKQGAVVSLLDEKEGPFPNLAAYDVVVRSPGVKPSHPRLQETRGNQQDTKKVQITTSTNLFFELSPTRNIIGVTGTKGKGTTSSMIYEILKASGKDVCLGGNIGTPPLDFIDRLTPDSYVILELSSFQLMDIKYSPRIAVILMITSEHLDYHADRDEYLEAKTGIVKFQTNDDHVIFNEDYEGARKIAIQSKGQKHGFSLHHPPANTDSVQLRLPGEHNLENAYAALTVTQILNIDAKTAVGALRLFKGLPHRLELVRELGGVKYYDDSFSTTPETTIAAIRSFEEPKILILGGSSKNSDFSELVKEIVNSPSIKAIIGIGKEWLRIKKQLQISNFNSDSIGVKFQIQIIEHCKNMQEIVKKAHAIAESGDIVLLSPACASFGMFQNYKDRGNQFKKYVNRLK